MILSKGLPGRPQGIQGVALVLARRGSGDQPFPPLTFRYTAPGWRASRGGGVDVAAALWGGIIGAIMAATVYAGFLALGLTRLDLLRFEGGMLLRERTNMVYIYGAVIQVVAGALLALAYRQLLSGIDAATYVGWGALLGLAQGVLAVLALPLLGALNRNVRAGDEPSPGPLGRRYGRLTPLALLVASVVFGTWVGIVLLP
jgi:hypothetical protein